MSDFETLGLKSGIWSGLLHREKAPAHVVLLHAGDIVADADVTEDGPGIWRIRAALPTSSLSDGVQSFSLLGSRGDGEFQIADTEVLGDLSIQAGEALDLDLRAELELIRSELDLLKREFRRLTAP